jgi:hypothetical protein
VSVCGRATTSPRRRSPAGSSLAPAGAAGRATSSAVPPPPADVLAATSGATTTPVAAADKRVAAGVKAALGVKAVGSDTTAYVLDVGSGTPVYAAAQTRPQIPASTLKVLTAATALVALGPQTRLTTTVVPGAAKGEIVLVGAGDATLTRSASARTWPVKPVPRPASIARAGSRRRRAEEGGDHEGGRARRRLAVHRPDHRAGLASSFTTGGVVARSPRCRSTRAGPHRRRLRRA